MVLDPSVPCRGRGLALHKPLQEWTCFRGPGESKELGLISHRVHDPRALGTSAQGPAGCSHTENQALSGVSTWRV